MSLYSYQARTPEGEVRAGTIEAPSLDLAVSALQRRSFVIVSLTPAEEKVPWYRREVWRLGGIKLKDIVILSRQLAILFEAKVPIIDSLKILAAESLKPKLRQALGEISTDIQGGFSITQALAKRPDIFSEFYVNMVRSGEESGKLEEVFLYLADYLERSYELLSKARNALIYPAFVLVVFVGVMAGMLVGVIPQISVILVEAGADIPIYTQLIIALSDFLRRFGVLLLLFAGVGGIFLWRYAQTEAGRLALSRLVLDSPWVGNLVRKFYVARFVDNLETLIVGGVSVLRALELSAEVVGNDIFSKIIREAAEAVKGGAPISEALSRWEDIPPLVTQMIKIGEETGKLDFMLKTMARFYRREVENAVDNLVGLIEPVMIIILGLGVGILVVSVLLPIYNISSTF